MLEAIGYHRDLARWAAAADTRVGRVLRVERGLASVLTETGEVRASVGAPLLSLMARDASQSPCVGDWAVVREWPDRRLTIERLVPRRNTLATCVGVHLLAANLDLVGIVVDGHRTPEPLLEMSRRSGAEVLVVEAGDADLLRDRLQQHLTLALVGPSPAARARLLHALVGDLAVRRSPGRQLHLLPSGGAVIDTPGMRAVA